MGRWMGMAMIAALAGLFKAAPARAAELTLSARGVGEAWQDPSISEVYRSGYFAGTVGMGWRPVKVLSLETEVGYMRVAGSQAGAFQMVPLTLDVCARLEREKVELFAGAGPALVAFTEQHTAISEEYGDTTSGTKLATDMRLGARIGTNLIQPRLHPASSIERLDVELTLGRRQQWGQDPKGGDGFDLSAWRAGVGLTLRM